MSNTISVTGNVGADATLKFIPSGAGVLEFSVADTPRRKNAAGDWEDAGDTIWFRVSVWGPLAEALVDTIVKGSQVTVTGTLTMRTYESNGEKRTSFDVRADTVGVREKRGATRQQSTRPPADDPWATAGSSGSDEPPW